MISKRILVCITTLAALTSVQIASADVMVWFDPASPSVGVGDTVAVDIMANFDDPVVGWGIDLVIDQPGYADWVNTTIGGAWDATTTLDGDGLAGLNFPNAQSGSVLLATVTFEGLAIGQTPLILGAGPEEDEGFLLESGVLAENIQFIPGCLTVIPEPGGIALLSLVGLATASRRH